ncbi:MAG TPA: nuclear transport factor 2 family protein [Streptosporangiaceae bacterium]
MTKALKPEDLTRLFVAAANRGDAAGIASLYEEDAVMAYPPGGQTVGRAAMTTTVARDGAGARAQVVRRQPDDSWQRLLDQPEFTPPGG